MYRGPTSTIPKFSRPNPSEFARHWRVLENLLPPGETEPFIYQILVDHFNLDKTKLIADAYLNLLTPFTDNIVALHEKFGHTHHLVWVLEDPDVNCGDHSCIPEVWSSGTAAVVA